MLTDQNPIKSFDITEIVIKPEETPHGLPVETLVIKDILNLSKELNNVQSNTHQGLNALPKDVLKLIINNLSLNNLYSTSKVCKLFSSLFNESLVIKAQEFGFTGKLQVENANEKKFLVNLFKQVRHFSPIILCRQNEITKKIDIETTLKEMVNISLDKVPFVFLSDAKIAKYFTYRTKKGEIKLKEGKDNSNFLKTHILKEAIKKRCKNLVELLLLHETNPIIIDLHDMTYLGKCEKNTLKIIQLVIDYNLDGTVLDSQNHEGESALMIAVQAGYAKVVKLLLKAKANVNLHNSAGETALIIAVKNQYKKEDDIVEMVEILLEGGALFDIQDLQGATALMRATDVGYIKVVNALLAKGVALELTDRRDRRALDYAITNRSNNSEVVKVLIAAGAKINIINKFNQSYLQNAVSQGVKMVNALLEVGALELEPEHGYKVLWAAATAHREDIEVVKALVAAGADLGPLSWDNRFSLMSNISCKDVIMAFLDAKGFDPYSDSVLSILRWGVKNKNSEIIDKLVERGVSSVLINSYKEQF